MARTRPSGGKKIRTVVVCLRRGKPGVMGVAMVLKSMFRQANVRAKWVNEGGLA